MTNDDDLAESDETFTLALGDLPVGLIAGNPSSVELTILDDGDIPPPSEVSVFVDPTEVNEGGAVTVELQLSETLTTDVEVPLIYPPGGMTGGTGRLRTACACAHTQWSGRGIGSDHDRSGYGYRR